MEKGSQFSFIGRPLPFYLKMEDAHISYSNGRRPQYSFKLNDLNYFKWGTTSKQQLRLKQWLLQRLG